MVYETIQKNLVYLDYENRQPIYSVSVIKQEAKGAYYKSFGTNPSECINRVLEDYEGYVNVKKTWYARHFTFYNDNEKNYIEFIPGDEE